MDKGEREMDLYPRKQHLTQHEVTKQHVGLCQKFGIAGVRMNGKRDEAGEASQNPILEPVRLIKGSNQAVTCEILSVVNCIILFRIIARVQKKNGGFLTKTWM